jgi:Tfp pilus assembly protein PilN
MLLVLAFGGSLWSLSRWSDYRKLNEVAKQDIEMINAELAALNGKGAEIQNELPPDQRLLLIGAHKLVASKSFGWSRLFADIEGVLPGNVSASRIAVDNIFQERENIKADLTFSVLARDYASVEQMINRMNNSGVFKAELRGQDLQTTDRSTYTEYTLRLVYTPESGYVLPSSTPAELVSNQGGNQ